MIPLESAQWMSQAACLNADREVFFPEKGGPGDDAKRICAHCPVVQECLDWALALPADTVGVWGGTTPKERRTLRRMGAARTVKPPAECGSPSGYGRHRRNGEDACEPCRRAHNARKREWREQRQRGAA